MSKRAGSRRPHSRHRGSAGRLLPAPSVRAYLLDQFSLRDLTLWAEQRDEALAFHWAYYTALLDQRSKVRAAITQAMSEAATGPFEIGGWHRVVPASTAPVTALRVEHVQVAGSNTICCFLRTFARGLAEFSANTRSALGRHRLADGLAEAGGVCAVPVSVGLGLLAGVSQRIDTHLCCGTLHHAHLRAHNRVAAVLDCRHLATDLLGPFARAVTPIGSTRSATGATTPTTPSAAHTTSTSDTVSSVGPGVGAASGTAEIGRRVVHSVRLAHVFSAGVCSAGVVTRAPEDTDQTEEQ